MKMILIFSVLLFGLVCNAQKGEVEGVIKNFLMHFIKKTLLS
ncbi:hypothetical protein [Flavobacterium acetivorans]|nr:hypothetical protein [Flavobacterium sp. F-29]